MKLNADPVTAGSYGTALPMDGGHYTITATAPHAATFIAELDLGAEKDVQATTIKIHVEDKPIVTKVEPKETDGIQPPPHQDDQVEKPVPPPAPPRSHVAPIVTTIAAVALGGGALGFELWGRDLLDQASKEPDDAKQNQLYNDANTRHYIAEGMGVGAVVVAGVAVWLWVRSSHAEPTAYVVPTASPDGGGLAVLGRF